MPARVCLPARAEQLSLPTAPLSRARERAGTWHVEAGAAKAPRWREQARGPQGKSGYGEGETGATGHKEPLVCWCLLWDTGSPGLAGGSWIPPCKQRELSASCWSAFALVCAVFLSCNENYPSGPVNPNFSTHPEERSRAGRHCMTRFSWALIPLKQEGREGVKREPASRDGHGLEGGCRWIPWVLQWDGWWGVPHPPEPGVSP